jgi:hypothetical protein
MRLYFDGALVNSFQISKTIATSPDPLRMGRWATEWFAGILDEVRIFARALTDVEVANMVSPPPLLDMHVPGVLAAGYSSTASAVNDAGGRHLAAKYNWMPTKPYIDGRTVGSLPRPKTIAIPQTRCELCHRMFQCILIESAS